ncbi:MAG: hypothetical protein RSB71_03380 [Bacilli bacterium]
MLSIWSNIKDFFEGIKEWFMANSSNPFLWVGIIIIGLLIFEFTYQALHKGD